MIPCTPPEHARHATRWARSICSQGLFVLSSLLVGCANAPEAIATDPCATPQADNEWAVSTPSAVGFDAAALCTLLKEAAHSKANIHGFLIERHGRLVAELYRKAPDSPINIFYGIGNPFSSNVSFDAQTLHDARSVSKSVVGLLFGIAIDKGRVSSLDASVLSAYPELAKLRSRQMDSITFRHLLTMSSGLQWDEWGRGAIGSDETPLYWTAQQTRFVLDRPLAALPGLKFNYNGGGTAVLADTLVRLSGKPLIDLVREELFEPLGITHWEWVADVHGRPLAFAGLRLRPRDMLKIGRLVNAKGRWQGRQVVPEEWIVQSIQPHVPTGINLLAIADEAVAYGFQWWTGRIAWQGRELSWAAALGNGGQRIFVVPALDLTVLITAGDYGSPQILHAENDLLLAVLSAISDSKTPQQ